MRPDDDNANDWKWKGKLEQQLKQKEGEPPRDSAEIFKAFSNALRGRGPGAILLGVLLVHMVTFISIMGFIFGIFVRLLICSYVMHVIAWAAFGKEDVPAWTMEDLGSEFRRGLTFLGIFVAAFLPALAARALLGCCLSLPGRMLFYGFLLIGIFFLPMMLLIGSVSDSFLRAINPGVILFAIRRVFRPYLTVFGLCAFSVLALIATSSTIERVRGLLALQSSIAAETSLSCLLTALGLYCLIVMGLILGKFYYCEEEEIFR